MNTPGMEDNTKIQKSNWLEELSAKSWSLEMTISGAVTYVVSLLPRQIDKGLDYYLEHLAPSQSKIALMFPILSYSFFMVVSRLLIAFFIGHLCVRALWVGTVGLHAAFPAGIRYENIPNVSEHFKDLARERYGTLEGFIKRLDNLSNKMFALAFALAMVFTGIGIIYLVAFSIIISLRNTLQPETLTLLSRGFYFTTFVVAVLIIGFNYYAKKRQVSDQVGRRFAKFQMAFGYFANPLFARSVNYLSLTFLSNVSRRTYYGGMVFIMIFMMFSTILVTLRKVYQLSGRTLNLERAYFSQGSFEYKFSSDAYDSLRPEENAVPFISIPSDFVQETYLPVFVKYPRYLDDRIEKLCGEINTTPDEHGSKSSQREKLDSMRIDCLSRFFQLKLNDSLYTSTNWMFAEKENSKGLITYLDVNNLSSGKHTLTILVPSKSRSDTTEVYAMLHFWHP